MELGSIDERELSERFPPQVPQAIRALREKLAERTAMIEELVWAMCLWAGDEDDSVHPDAYPAFRAAIAMVGISITDEATPGDESDSRYRFDLDWSEKQRDQWRKRMKEVERV